MTLTPLLIVGLLVSPPAVRERQPTGDLQVAVEAIRPLLAPDAFRSDRAKNLKLDFRPAPGSFSKFTRDSSVDQAPSRAAVQTRKRSTARKIVGAAVGAFGGFFLGGYAGAAIEGDRCNCDDPGLQGFLIGAPIGAVAGGIFGAWISGK
jgi:hypothetical protein